MSTAATPVAITPDANTIPSLTPKKPPVDAAPAAAPPTTSTGLLPPERPLAIH
jgi:hypothetical protein